MSHPEDEGLGWLEGGGDDAPPAPAAKKPAAGKPATGKQPALGKPAAGDGPSADVLDWLSGHNEGGDTIVSPSGKQGGTKNLGGMSDLGWLDQEKADSAAQGEDESATPALIHEDEDEAPAGEDAQAASESMFSAALDDFFAGIDAEEAGGESLAAAPEQTLTSRGKKVKEKRNVNEGKIDKVVGTLIRYLTRKDPIKETQIDSIFKLTVGKLVDAINAEILTVYYPIDEKKKLHIQGVYWAKNMWRGRTEGEAKFKKGVERLQNVTIDPTQGIEGRSLEKKISVTSLDATKDPDFKNHIGSATGIEVGPMLTVPIMDGENYGVIQVMNKDPQCGEEFFSYQDQKLMEEIAGYCAKIIHRVKDPKITTTEQEMAKFVARLAKAEVMDPTAPEIEWDDRLWEVVGVEHIQKYMILPRKALTSKALSVIMVNPLDFGKRSGFEAATEKSIEEAFVATKAQIEAVLAKKFKKAQGNVDTSDLGALAGEVDNLSGEKVELKAEDEKEDAAPIIKLANRIIEDAYARGASDIHIEPYEQDTRVRYRVDGNLEQRMTLPKKAINPLISRLKIMANLDIAERRLPQDGRIKFKQYSRTGLDLDLRVATGPMAFGEKCVMRLLVKGSIALGLDAMGFSPKNLELFRWASKQAYGMILNVGPTGSGKTTTLYSALSEVNTIDVNIQTAEDPIEYPLAGINQMQMHKDIGLTFASALRCYLRMDPDIILVGEIRDLETAEIAIEASLTGHLLFSTLHTNDAAGTVTRFIEMGVEPFMVSSCLLLVCAQRLGRRLCKTCKVVNDKILDSEKAILMQDDRPINQLFTTKEGGCEKCGNTGYKGRVGIHEVLTLNEELRDLINKSVSSDIMKAAGIRNGMRTLWQDGLWKVKEGIMDLKELMSNVRADGDMKSG